MFFACLFASAFLCAQDHRPPPPDGGPAADAGRLPPPPPPGMRLDRPPRVQHPPRAEAEPWQPPPPPALTSPPPPAPVPVAAVPETPTAPTHGAPANDITAPAIAPAPNPPPAANADARIPATTATVRPAPPATVAAPAATVIRTTVVDHFVDHVPRWVWWVGIAFPAMLLLLGWSMRRQARMTSERRMLERQQRILETRQHDLRIASEHLRRQATNDPLTGILNRRAFADDLRGLLEHLARFGRPLDLIVFDLDHFKQINDQQGHLAGDNALKLVVGVVHQHLHSDDLFGRFGGDEFLIGCADRASGETARLAESIRHAVVTAASQATPPLTGLSPSMGLARASRECGHHLETLFAQADSALYAAKRSGRNRVVVASDELPAPPTAETVARQLA